MRIVVDDVLHQMKLEGGQPGWKRLVEFAQDGGVRANHKHTIHFDGAKVTVIDLHGQEVVPEGAEVSRMR